MSIRPGVLALAALALVATSATVPAPARAQFMDPGATTGGSCRQVGGEEGSARIAAGRLPVSLRLWQLAAQLIPQKPAGARPSAYARPVANFTRARSAR